MHTSKHDDVKIAETTTSTRHIPEPDVEINPDAIPEILKIHDHWAPFRMTWDSTAGRFKKGPRLGFKNNDASTLLPFDKACARINGDTAVAYTLTGTGLIAIDLDHCITDGKLSPSATRIVRMFAGTYIEKSISGDGVHIFVYGRTGMNGNEKLVIDGTEIDIEVYAVPACNS